MEFLSKIKNQIIQTQKENDALLVKTILKETKERYPALFSVTYFIETPQGKYSILTSINNCPIIYKFRNEHQADEGKARLVEMNFTENEYNQVSEVLNLPLIKQVSRSMVPSELINPNDTRYFTFEISLEGELLPLFLGKK